jgi:hypothetical protein
MTTRRLRTLRALFLSVLLLVPAIVSGHHHATHPTVPCATCAVTQHTPVATAGLVSVSVTAELVVDVALVAAAQPNEPSIRSATGRGPPTALLSLEV